MFQSRHPSETVGFCITSTKSAETIDGCMRERSTRCLDELLASYIVPQTPPIEALRKASYTGSDQLLHVARILDLWSMVQLNYCLPAWYVRPFIQGHSLISLMPHHVSDAPSKGCTFHVHTVQFCGELLFLPVIRDRNNRIMWGRNMYSTLSFPYKVSDIIVKN